MLNRKQLTSIIFALAGLALTAPMMAADAAAQEQQRRLLHQMLTQEQQLEFQALYDQNKMARYHPPLLAAFRGRIGAVFYREMLLHPIYPDAEPFYVMVAPSNRADLDRYMDLMNRLNIPLAPLQALMARFIHIQE